MNARELKQKSKEELKALLEEKRERLVELRELIHRKKAKNVKEISAVKRDIARILTLLNSL